MNWHGKVLVNVGRMRKTGIPILPTLFPPTDKPTRATSGSNGFKCTGTTPSITALTKQLGNSMNLRTQHKKQPQTDTKILSDQITDFARKYPNVQIDITPISQLLEIDFAKFVEQMSRSGYLRQDGKLSKLIEIYIRSNSS